MATIKKYINKNGYLYYQDKNTGYEEWIKQNKKGLLIYYKNSDGVEWTKKYDSNKNVIYYSDKYITKKYRYNKKNYKTYYFDGESEYFYRYNKNNQLILEKVGEYKTCYTYYKFYPKIKSIEIYDNNCKIYEKRFNKTSDSISCFDKKSDLIYKKTQMEEIFYKYNEHHQCIYSKDLYGDNLSKEIWRKYDNNGNEIEFKDSRGYMYRNEYNDLNQLIFRMNSYGEFVFYIYDEKGFIINRFYNKDDYEKYTGEKFEFPE